MVLTRSAGSVSSCTTTMSSSTPVTGLGNNQYIIGNGGGSNAVPLSAAGAWTATANDSWLHLTSSSGSGSSNVGYTVDPFAGLGSRTGTLTIQGLPFAVTQVGTNWAAVSGLTTLVTYPQPLSLVTDSTGNIYFIEGSQIVKYVPSTHQTVPVVTSGLTLPTNLAIDGQGNLYICDQNGIEKWTASTQQLTHLITEFGYGVAVDGAGNVYFSDTTHYAIKEWIASSQQVVTLASSLSGEPYGMSVDIFGNVYFALPYNNAIGEWDASTQQVTTPVGSGLSWAGGRRGRRLRKSLYRGRRIEHD